MNKLKSDIEQIEHKTEKIKTLIDEIRDVYKSMNTKPQPRQLKPGDFAMGENGNIYLVLDGGIGKPPRGSLLNISGEMFRQSIFYNLTPIDTLTEEHLKMLDTDEYRFSLTQSFSKTYYWVDRLNKLENKQYRFTKDYPTASEGIAEALRSEISRRYVDRMIGGK